jgi:DNA repair protein RAD51
MHSTTPLQQQHQNPHEDEDDVDMEESTFVGIEALEEMGVNAGDVQKLRDGGFYTIESVLHATRRKLMKIKGFSDAKVTKVKTEAAKLAPSQFTTATEVAQARGNMAFISTGSSSLDELLGGGIEPGNITELDGEFRTGKTQIRPTWCDTAQVPRGEGGAGGRALLIDTEGGFRPARITQIAERFGLDPRAVLDNISVARAHNSEHQMELLTAASAMMAESLYAILIVDSATALFRTDYTGRGELADRQQKLAQFLRQLAIIAQVYNVAVVITNQVTANPGGSMFVRDNTTAIGGNIMAHSSTTRLKLRKGRGENRVMKVIDSPTLPESDAEFALSDGGVVDAV